MHDRGPLAISGEALKPSRQLDLAATTPSRTPELIDCARHTVALCYCEGQIHVTARRIRRCQKCYHTTCERCGGNPQHDYGSYGTGYAFPRQIPQNFEDLIKKALPMQLRLTNLDIKTLANIRTVDEDNIWSSIVFDLAVLGVEDLRFRSAVRNEKWTVTFSSSKYRLDLVFSRAKDTWKATWFLYALAHASHKVESSDRKTRVSPIARMEPQDDILSGCWHFRVPSTRVSRVRISGKGTRVPSWEAKLGLTETRFAEMTVYDKLSITLADLPSEPEPKASILGEYELLPNCGTACHSLYKQIQVGEKAEPLFLFLDPDRYEKSANDYFVFARETFRLGYQEHRHIIARLSNTWRPTALSTHPVDCFADSDWVPIAADLQKFDGTAQPRYAVVKPSHRTIVAQPKPITGPKQKTDCANATFSILSCNVPVGAEDFGEWQGSKWITIEPPHHSAVLHELYFVMNRVRDLDDFPDHWRSLQLPVHTGLCMTCAPRPPTLKWQSKGKGNSWRMVPYEHEDEAKNFEDLMASRPQALVLQAYKDHVNTAHFRIGLNVATLAHQALANLLGFDPRVPFNTKPVSAEWRLDVHYQHHRKPTLPTFTLRHNRGDRELHHRFPEQHLRLRVEQRRSLAWMVDQERGKTKPFMRQEISECMIPELHCRVEVKVQQAIDSAKGGVLADEVGYGKTITVLALIDSRKQEAQEGAKIRCRGLIPTKATLIIVPSTLLKQWEKQAGKFLGNACNILTISSLTQLNNKSIKQIQEADIVIAAWGMFEGGYLGKVAYLATLPIGPNATGGRAFEFWLQDASAAMSRTLEDMETAEKDEELETFADTLNERVAQNENNPRYTRRLPTRRTKGAQFSMENKRFQEKKETGTAAVDYIDEAGGEAAKVKQSENIFNLTNCAGKLQNVRGLPLHIFRWNRIVLDEYTYVGPRLYKAIVTIPTLYRWVLSGTPLLGNFSDVKELAGLIGVNLGIDDDTRDSMSGANIRKFRAERTSAEIFRAFNEDRSPVWYERRHEHAQVFLDFFVRQNRAEIEEIKCKEQVIALRQHPVERAMYLEQEQQVRGQDMRLIRSGTAKGQKGQVSRLSSLLNNSTTAEEALLKNAAFSDFGGGTRKTPDAACEQIINQRFSSLHDCISDIEMQFKKATWLLKKCDTEFPDVHYAKFCLAVANGSFGDEDAAQMLLDRLEKARKAYHPDHGELFFLPEKEHEKYVKGKNEKLKQERKDKKEQEKAAKAAQKDKEKAAKQAKKAKEEQNGDENQPDEAGEQVAAEEAAEAEEAENRAIEESWAEVEFDILPETPGDSRDHLRTLAGRLHGIARELVEWLRGVRYLLAVRHVQKAQVPGSNLSCKCSGCQQVIADLGEVAVLGKCGHIACKTCLELRGRELSCVERDCQAPALQHHVHFASALGVDDPAPIQYGSKTDAIITLLRTIPQNEQVLLFVQWHDLGHQLEKALEQKEIGFYSLLHVAAKDRNAAMDKFQSNAEASPEYRQVLLLNSSDESAAGA